MKPFSCARSAVLAAILLACGAEAPPPSVARTERVAPVTAKAQPATPLVAHLEDGDILLHPSKSSQSAALRAATGSPYTHVGLAFPRDGVWLVLEAVQPVRWTPLDDWLKRGRDQKVVVLRLVDPSPLAGGGKERLWSA